MMLQLLPLLLREPQQLVQRGRDARRVRRPLARRWLERGAARGRARGGLLRLAALARGRVGRARLRGLERGAQALGGRLGGGDALAQGLPLAARARRLFGGRAALRAQLLDAAPRRLERRVARRCGRAAPLGVVGRGVELGLQRRLLARARVALGQQAGRAPLQRRLARVRGAELRRQRDDGLLALALAARLQRLDRLQQHAELHARLLQLAARGVSGARGRGRLVARRGGIARCRLLCTPGVVRAARSGGLDARSVGARLAQQRVGVVARRCSRIGGALGVARALLGHLELRHDRRKRLLALARRGVDARRRPLLRVLEAAHRLGGARLGRLGVRAQARSLDLGLGEPLARRGELRLEHLGVNADSGSSSASSCSSSAPPARAPRRLRAWCTRSGRERRLGRLGAVGEPREQPLRAPPVRLPLARRRGRGAALVGAHPVGQLDEPRRQQHLAAATAALAASASGSSRDGAEDRVRAHQGVDLEHEPLLLGVARLGERELGRVGRAARIGERGLRGGELRGEA